MTSPTPDFVYVSYASQDRDIAKALVDDLEQNGIKCWIAPRDVSAHVQHTDEIMAAVNKAELVIVVWSEHAIASPHVGREIERAASKPRGIIALRTDAAALTRSFEYFLKDAQWVDVRALGLRGALSKLTSAAQQRLASSSWVSPGLGADVRHSSVRRRGPTYRTIRRAIIGLLLLAAAAVFIGVLVRYWPQS